MGGYGSTRWIGHWPKQTVEGCRCLSVNRWRREGIVAPETHGRGLWGWHDAETEEVRARIGYEVQTTAVSGWVRLMYTFSSVSGGEEKKSELDYRTQLVTTPCHFGGMRWWFRCGLMVNARPCGRRVAKLYLPPRAKCFGCRHCHNLTYRSAQESDKRLKQYRHLSQGEIWTLISRDEIDLTLALKLLNR